MTTASDYKEVHRLRAAWKSALADKERTEDGDEWEYYSAAEQRAYDALIDEVEACGLNYTEFDPRPATD